MPVFLRVPRFQADVNPSPPRRVVPFENFKV
jgi:hypothetical protein